MHVNMQTCIYKYRETDVQTQTT